MVTDASQVVTTEEPSVPVEPTPPVPGVEEAEAQQEPEATPEETTDKFVADIIAEVTKPEAAAEDVAAEEAKQQEQVRREAQRMREKERAAERKKGAIAEEHQTKRAAIVSALENGKQPSDRDLDDFGMAWSKAEFFPDVDAAVVEAIESTPGFSDLEQSVQDHILEDLGEHGKTTASRLSRLFEVHDEQTAAQSKKAGLPHLKQVLGNAVKTAYERGLADGRGNIPPRLGEGGATGTTQTFEQLEHLYAIGEATLDQQAAYMAERRRRGYI